MYVQCTIYIVLVHVSERFDIFLFKSFDDPPLSSNVFIKEIVVLVFCLN